MALAPERGIQSILTTQVAIYVLLRWGSTSSWASPACSTSVTSRSGRSGPIPPPFSPERSDPPALHPQPVLGHPVLDRCRHVGRRPARDTHTAAAGDYLAIVTLGFGEIIEIVANNLNGVTGGPAGTPGSSRSSRCTSMRNSNMHWTGTVLPYYYLILGVAVVFTIAFSFLEHSRVGRSWTAIREDEVAADSMGINALKYKVMAFAIGASTAGFAGVFFASQVQSLVPNDFIVQTSILILVFVIFGGMGSIAGAVIGAFVIQWLPSISRSTRSRTTSSKTSSSTSGLCSYSS